MVDKNVDAIFFKKKNILFKEFCIEQKCIALQNFSVFLDFNISYQRWKFSASIKVGGSSVNFDRVRNIIFHVCTYTFDLCKEEYFFFFQRNEKAHSLLIKRTLHTFVLSRALLERFTSCRMQRLAHLNSFGRWLPISSTKLRS